MIKLLIELNHQAIIYCLLREMHVITNLQEFRSVYIHWTKCCSIWLLLMLRQMKKNPVFPLFPQFCLFYLQLLILIVVPGKMYLEVHQKLSWICFPLAVYQFHIVPISYAIIKIHTLCYKRSQKSKCYCWLSLASILLVALWTNKFHNHLLLH